MEPEKEVIGHMAETSIPCPHCTATFLTVSGKNKHIRAQHPDLYEKRPYTRKPKDAIAMPPADDLFGTVLKALYGDSIPVSHLPHVLVFRDATRAFVDAVSK